ncbi:MAG TPA: thioesterase family protein [Allosphingosinicella sp.]|nr:thioesterase family protein [Allosphingosinicella sp.]
MSFADDTELVERDGALFAEISPRWDIWGPNGGYLAAIALRAAGLRVEGGQRPAGISCQYLRRGRFGEARLEVETLKAGRSASCFGVTLVQEGERTLTAQVWTTAAPHRPDPQYVEIEMPAVAPPEALAPPPEDPGGFAFWRNFDLRIASPERPGHGNPRGARTERWLRFHGYRTGADRFLAQARSLLLIDTLLWPAHWARRAERLDYVGPSLDVAVWFHAPSGADEWLLIEAAAPLAADGLVYGEGRVWTKDGRLVASGGSHMLVMPVRPGFRP